MKLKTLLNHLAAAALLVLRNRPGRAYPGH